MYVCVCNQVTDGQIRRAAEAGVTSMESLQASLKVATCCGRGRDCASRVLRDALETQWQGDFAVASA